MRLCSVQCSDAFVSHLRVLRLVEAHHERFKLASLITHRYSLAEAEKGINAARTAESIKVVLTPNS